MNKGLLISILIFAFSLQACRHPTDILTAGDAKSGLDTTSVQPGDSLVRMAHAFYDSGDEEKARKLYQQAAAMDNADGHFNLAYRFELDREKSVFHFSAAARKGHAEALDQCLDLLFFRAVNLSFADPQRAMEIYETAKMNNPTAEIFEEDRKVHTLKKCLEAGPFDKDRFLSQYRIKQSDLEQPYDVWELAEEASRGGRFGTPNPQLILQLISRGGFVPAELESAVDSAYQNWKANKVFEFNICDFISSGFGMGYCAYRKQELEDIENKARVFKLSKQLENNAGEILQGAYNVASKYFETKAWNEELNGGSGYAAWTVYSIMSQKNNYLNLIEKIRSSNLDSIQALGDSSIVLNQLYQSIVDTLKKGPITDFNAEVNLEGFQSVQKQWMKYRDSSAYLFSLIAPAVKKQQWINWLTVVRIKELRDLSDRIAISHQL